MTDQPPSEPVEAFDNLGLWPIDVSTLVKGADVTVAECERILGYGSTHPKYPFELMGLREFIIRESLRRAQPLSVAIRGSALHINTDSEAVDYHDALAAKGERAIVRNFHMMRSAIDTGQLTSEQRLKLDRNTALWAMKVGGLRTAALSPPPSAPAAIEGAQP